MISLEKIALGKAVAEKSIIDPALLEIARKLDKEERLTKEDGLTLFSSNDLLGIGMLADIVRSRISGSKVYYTTNLNLNPTNVCVLRCSFCAFRRNIKDEDAYVISIEEAVQKTVNPNIKEVHVVGGLHPNLKLEYYESLLSAIKCSRPDVYINGFTAVEVDYFAKLNKISIEEVLERLKASGLNGIPGGGAEVFSPRVRKIICPNKISGERWLEIMETAHMCGIKTNATILYGHIETIKERIEHLIALRKSQDKTDGFKTFVPLSFQPYNTKLADSQDTSCDSTFSNESFCHDMSYNKDISYNDVSEHNTNCYGTTGFDDLKTYAISRLMLDNFPHIKALWNYIGLKVAQTALFFGVDDLGGTAMEEQIASRGGANHGIATKEMLERIILDAGKEPVYSNSGYLPIN